MNQEEVWDVVAKKWSEFRKTPPIEVEEFLKNKKGKILDLGCGSGRNFSAIRGEIYGIDFSKQMILLASKNHPSANLLKSPASRIPFPDNFFDAAIFIAALHCIESENERKQSLKELHRVLKPKSKALISVWSHNHERIKKLGLNYLPWTTETIKVKRYYYIYTKEELSAILENTGFKIISIKEDDNIWATIQKH